MNGLERMCNKGMVETTVEVKLKNGLQARQAALFVQRQTVINPISFYKKMKRK